MNALPRLLTVLSVLGLASFAARASLVQYKAAVAAEPSLISYYTFDLSSAADSKSSNNGTAVGTTSYKSGVGGGSDKALVLSGKGHINLGEVAAFDFSGGIGTVEAWVRADWTNNPGYNPAIFAERDGGPVNWSVHMNGSKGGVGLWNGATYEPLPMPAAGTNWHHLAVVFNFDGGTSANSFTVYWDGAALGTTSQGPSATSNLPTELGSSSAAGLERWLGALDEVAFYSDALTADAVKAHYIAFLVGDPPTIQTQPQGGTFLPGVSLNLSVGAKGAQLSYQWFKGSNAIPGATNSSLILPQLGATNVASYYVTVSNAAGQVPSDVVQVALGDLPARLKLYQAAVRAESSLISYYTFDELDAADSKSANNGTPAGNAAYADGVGGAAGKALALDGSGHINLGQVDAFDFVSGTGTVEAWIRAGWTNSPGYDPALFADRDGGPVNWSVHLNRGKEAAGMWNGSAYFTGPTPGAGTAWHHLAIVFDIDMDTGNPMTSFYWDGILANSGVQGFGNSPESPTELGASSVAGGEGWIGGLDEVAFYSDALSAAAIQAHFSAFAVGSPPVITVPPAGGSFLVGDALALTVGAQGLDLTYQWYKNNAILTNATGPILNLAPLAVSDAGTYRVRVSNGAGSKDSDDAIVVVTAPDIAAYQAAVRAESSLISYYTFDAGDATDSKGSNNGTEQGLVAFTTGIGRGLDQALALDGSSHIDLGPVSAFDFVSGKGTAEAWVRADWTASPAYNPAIFADRDGGPVVWSVHMNNGKDAAGLWNGSTYQPLSIGNAGTTWHHLAVVFDFDSASSNSVFSVYWDGQGVGHTFQALGPAVGSPTELGASASGPDGGENWIGALDEVAFYSEALSAEAIGAHYHSFFGQKPPAPSLAIAVSGTHATISWPLGVTGYALETTPQLLPASWTRVSGVASNSVVVDVGSGNGFYRLTGP